MGERLGVKQVRYDNNYNEKGLSFFSQLDDWYKITRKDVSRLGGKSLFYKYHSLAEVLTALYPNHAWHMQQFARATPKLSDPIEQRNALEEIGRQLNIKQVCTKNNNKKIKKGIFTLRFI